MPNAKIICTVCNHIYDEAMGEPLQEILPGLKFENLPEQWRCPECSSDKEMFQPCSCINFTAPEQTCPVHSSARNSGDTDQEADQAALCKTASVGDLVAKRPGRAVVFEKHGIDYCCGGQATLEDACKKKGLNIESVIAELSAEDRKDLHHIGSDWTTASLKELVEHIIATYHKPLRQELPRVAQLAEKVSRVHGDSHPEMVEVRNIFNRMRAQLELHMQKEEMVLFPGIIAMESTGSPQIFGCGGGIEHPIEVMTNEHDQAGADLSAMRRLTHDYTAPPDACGSFKVLLHSLGQIESEMHQHVHKENHILFPRALELRKPAAISR